MQLGRAGFRVIAFAALVLTTASFSQPISQAQISDPRPCRAISDNVNPRFAGLWVTEEGVWVADDLNHSLILFDRSTGAILRLIRGLRTELDFPAAVQFDATMPLPDGTQGVIWASMNDTSDRLIGFSKDLGNPNDPDSVDARPNYVLDYNTLTLDDGRIYNGDRVYGFQADPSHDEMVFSVEKINHEDADGSSSIGSVIVTERGGEDPAQLGMVKRWIRGPHTGLANPHGVWIDTQHQEIYTTNYGLLPKRPPQPPSITVYARLADGDAVPGRVIQGHLTHLGRPIKVVVDNQRNEIIVADDEEGVLVFDRLAKGDIEPKRMIHSHAMPNGVFFDEVNDELVVANWFERTIQFFDPVWDPTEMHPAPKHTIAINSQEPVIVVGNPGALAFIRDEIVAPNCVSHPGFSVYPRTANGVVRPLRLVEGHDTQMSRSIHGLAGWEHPTDPSQDEVFIPKPLGEAILVFNRTADGNVAPMRVIQGRRTLLGDNDALAVEGDEIAVPNRDNRILIFGRTDSGDVPPRRIISYEAGTRNNKGVWLGPWGEGSTIRLGPAVWFDTKGTADPADDEIVVRARYQFRDPVAGLRTQGSVVFFPRNADGPTIPTRIIASTELTGVHQVTVFNGEVFSAVQGVRRTFPPEIGGLVVFDTDQTSTLNPDGRSLSDIPAKRILRAGDINGGSSGVKHPRAVAVDRGRREVYLGDSKGNNIRVFPLDWLIESCVKE